MSAKFSARNSFAASPLRSNTFIVRSNVVNKPSSKRSTGLKKFGEKIVDEKKIESINNRENKDEFATSELNLTLVGSPAPRSQIRATVSSASTTVKSKVKHSYNSKSREQNAHEICMEKLYQFADNPTKFVHTESREDSHLKLDLEFSDHSDESENVYDSHNIAFGKNGEYRIPEYDHIRFLQFSVGDAQDSGEIQDRDTSASIKSDNSITARNNSSANKVRNDKLIRENPPTSRTSNGSQTSTSQRSDGSLDSSEGVAQVEDLNPWISKMGHTLQNWTKSSSVLDLGQNFPLGSAINYKNNINPEVEKFMLNTELVPLHENYTTVSLQQQLDPIFRQNSAQVPQRESLQVSIDNSSRTSPETSRTTLSQASSSDGTWHGHSLNSPYFASKESNSWTDTKSNVDREASINKVVVGNYEETDEYLTIIKNEHDSTFTSETGGVGGYIFITDQIVDPELHSQSSSQSLSGHSHSVEKPAKSSTCSSTTKSEDDSVTKMNRPDDDAKDISSGNASTSDYCIGKLFSRSPSSSSSSSSSFSSSVFPSSKDEQPVNIERNLPTRASLDIETELKGEENDVGMDKCKISGSQKAMIVTEKRNTDLIYMTRAEVNLAIDYTNKLSEIFKRALERSANKDQRQDAKETIVNPTSSGVAGFSNTPKLIYRCLGSPHFCTSYLSS
ncbi:dentin sialophosphoprotein-like [Neodiprion pinetum]|uniref:dentin sialophosphoprotein-like n=1 Tax=Neodiprion pinetum TaxID=441929 RepID=UPI00371CDC5F